jgi:hypothetical protein
VEHICDWCGQPAVTTRRIEKRKLNGINVWVCRTHSEMIDVNVRIKDLVSERKRLTKGVRSDTDITVGRVKVIEEELRKLGAAW